jgi:hypothetical protein
VKVLEPGKVPAPAKVLPPVKVLEPGKVPEPGKVLAPVKVPEPVKVPPSDESERADCEEWLGRRG